MPDVEDSMAMGDPDLAMTPEVFTDGFIKSSYVRIGTVSIDTDRSLASTLNSYGQPEAKMVGLREQIIFVLPPIG